MDLHAKETTEPTAVETWRSAVAVHVATGDRLLKRWTALKEFVEDGSLKIDNNLVEKSIRPSVLEKENWLFVGHPEAGERSALIYTLLGSCRRHGVNLFDYLNDLFIRLPAAKITQIK